MTTRLTRWLTALDNFEAKMALLPAVRRYGQRLFLMPLEEVEGILPGARVYARNGHGDGLQSGKQLPLGPALLGRVQTARRTACAGYAGNRRVNHAAV